MNAKNIKGKINTAKTVEAPVMNNKRHKSIGKMIGAVTIIVR
jgi:hypothetical protein